MKKNYLIAMFLLLVNLVSAQLDPTTYRGAFAPAPTAMWTDSWINFDPKNEAYPDAATVVNVTTDITANTTWTTGKTYKLTGLIYVRNNATLTIQPGVVVKGQFTNTGTALIITKGAKLNAIGTATSPIVFTSGKTVAEGRQPGDWGGIVLLGKAGFNVNNGINNIEGITANVNTEYGGGLSPINNDNSGTLKYVRIEFGGYVFSPNNEINGLTMGAVGNGTTIDYVQVSYANDDAFEWFGGSVNCKHLVAFRNVDDEFDTDNGYKGTVQYALAVKDPSLADNPTVSTSEGFESDNNAAGTTVVSPLDNTSAIFTNITVIGPAVRATLAPATSVASGHERALRLRRATQLKVYNSIFMDFKNNFVFIDGSAAVANANGGTLKFKNNIIAGTVNPSFTGGVNPTSLNSWFTTNGNSILSTSAGLLALPYSTTNTYLGLDYRPAGVALSGADFTDASIAPFVNSVVGSTPVVSNLTYCKGAVATPLTATLTTTGVSLRWYTVATGGTFSTTAPTPATTVVGVKNYYVSQVDGGGIESARVLLTVTTFALPTEVVGAIIGVGPVGSTSATAVGPYIGTTAQFTYSIPAFVDTTLNYLWTVPNGVNIVSGQGTNSIVVNFANSPGGAGNVGSIQVQAVNANGCKTLAKSLLLTKALPLAPAVISMTNKNPGYPSPTIALTSYAKYMGSTTPLTLTCSTITSASAYQWELPAGVSLSFPAGTPAPVTTTLTYTTEPFLTPSAAPNTVGNKYWVITYNKYTVDVNGVPTEITVSTCDQKIFGTAAYGGVTTQPYPRYGTVIESNLPAILINFAGVTNPATTALYLGVKSKNGVGTSTTLNTANADVVANAIIPGLYYTSYNEAYTFAVPPSTPATSTFSVASTTVVKNSKLKKLTAAIPAAPSTVKLYNDAISSTVSTTVVSKYIGTTTPLRLVAGVLATTTASSFQWELPAGVNQISGGNSNEIIINFAGVAPGTTSLYLGVKGVNGIGTSITNNAALVPATSSTAKLVKVTAAVPAAVSIVTGPISGICGGDSYSYTITASTLANSYTITAPVGSVVTSASNPTNASETLSTSDLSFSITYPSNLATLANKNVVISAINGVGASLTNKTLAIATTFSPILTVSSEGGLNFTRCATKTFTASSTTPGIATYTWLTAAGAVIVSGQGTNTVVIDFSAVPLTSTTNLLKVTASNACGVSGAPKSSSLASISCARMDQSSVVENNEVVTNEVAIVRSEMYPNPTSGEFNVTIENATRGEVEMAIFSLDGIMVMAPKTMILEEGNTTITENVSNLNKGIYIVKLISSSSKEVMVKKLIKE